MPLQFDVFDHESGAFKYPDLYYDGALATFDGLLDEHQAGQLRDKPYLAALDQVLTEEADGYPPYFYELALCQMLRNEWVAAATALRKGFIANPYIAERIGGNSNPVPLPIWHDSNLGKPETAQDYLGMYGALWHSQSGSYQLPPKVTSSRVYMLMNCTT